MSRMIMVHLEMYVILLTMAILVVGMYNIKKRYRKALVAQSMVLVAAGFILSVIFSDIEKDRIAFSNSFSIAAVIYTILVLIVVLRSTIFSSKHPGTDAVIQAFDKMDGGIAYCEENGRVILCNEVLHGISIQLTGTRVLSGTSFIDSVKKIGHMIGESDSYELELQGNFYYVSVRNISVKDTPLMEIRCDDITTLHEKQLQLREDNEKLEKINRRLNEYGRTADQVVKEQEILNAKIRIHDRFGALLLGTKRAIEQNAPEEELRESIEGFGQLISLINSGDKPTEQNYYEELEKVASQIGVEIHLDGELPQDEKKNELCCNAIRECVTNTFKHAGGHNLYVKLGCDEGRETVRITNDGMPPSGPILLGTGLSSLKAKVEKASGDFCISHSPEFVLEIKL